MYKRTEQELASITTIIAKYKTLVNQKTRTKHDIGNKIHLVDKKSRE